MTHETPVADDEIPVNSTDDDTAAPPSKPGWVYAAVAFTFFFTAIHLYWALGGEWGLPLLALHDKSVVRSVDWVVCVVMVIGAVLVLALNHPISRRIRPSLLLVPIGIGSVVCVSHGIYGFITKTLYLSGVHGAVAFPTVPGVSAATAAAKNHLSAVQDLIVFEPCFAIEGVLIALAAWQFIRTRTGRRRWLVTVLAGTLVIDVFGTLLSVVGMRFAVS